nr:hypothetical protein [uncultured Anaerocolumna sp.]
MNKLQGFYSLEKSNLPAVPWRKYSSDTIFSDNILWTVRSAVKEGEDLNLPRKVGVRAEIAKEFAKNLYSSLNSEDLIIYYPYFIALKSGVIDISQHRTVIEAVKDDLWNLVTYNKKDVTIIFNDDIEIIGNEKFFEQNELLELIDYCITIRKKFQSEISNQKSVLLEWSFACESDLYKNPIGDARLVFYEIRTV